MDAFRATLQGLAKPTRAVVEGLAVDAAALAATSAADAHSVAVAIASRVGGNGGSEGAVAALMVADAVIRSSGPLPGADAVRGELTALLPAALAALAAAGHKAPLTQGKALVKAWKRHIDPAGHAALSACLNRGAAGASADGTDAPGASTTHEVSAAGAPSPPQVTAAAAEAQSALLRLLVRSIGQLPPPAAAEFRRALAAHPALSRHNDPAVHAFLATIADSVARRLVEGGGTVALGHKASTSGAASVIDDAIERLTAAGTAAAGGHEAPRVHPPPYVCPIRSDRSGSLATRPGGELPASKGLGHPYPRRPISNPFVLRAAATRDRGGSVRPPFLAPYKWEGVRRFRVEAPSAVPRDAVGGVSAAAATSTPLGAKHARDT